MGIRMRIESKGRYSTLLPVRSIVHILTAWLNCIGIKRTEEKHEMFNILPSCYSDFSIHRDIGDETGSRCIGRRPVGNIDKETPEEA